MTPFFFFSFPRLLVHNFIALRQQTVSYSSIERCLPPSSPQKSGFLAYFHHLLPMKSYGQTNRHLAMKLVSWIQLQSWWLFAHSRKPPHIWTELAGTAWERETLLEQQLCWKPGERGTGKAVVGWSLPYITIGGTFTCGRKKSITRYFAKLDQVNNQTT